MSYKKGGAIVPKSLFFSIASYLTFYPIWAIAFVIDWLIYHISIKNRWRLIEHFMKGGKAIIVSNHTTVFDPVKISACVLPFSIYHTLLANTVSTPILGTFIQLLGGIPMPSFTKLHKNEKENKKEDMYNSFILAFKNALSKRPAVHIYPEGECSLQSGIVQKFHNGAFIASIKLSLPVFPIATVFTKRAYFGIELSRPKVTMYVLPPIYPTNFTSEKEFAAYTQRVLQEEIVKRGGVNDFNKGRMKRIKGVN